MTNVADLNENDEVEIEASEQVITKRRYRLTSDAQVVPGGMGLVNIFAVSTDADAVVLAISVDESNEYEVLS